MYQKFAFILSFIVSNIGLAADLSAELHAFYTNPAQEMAKIPKKIDNGSPSARLIFKPQDVRSKKYMSLKQEARESASWINGTPGLRGRATARSSHLDFLDQKDFQNRTILNRLDEIESAGLMSARLAETPWSDNYWPIYQGILGSRYASSSFMSKTNYTDYFNFVSKESLLQDVISSGAEKDIDSLSPSEKYDLLVGGVTSTEKMGMLTNANWSEGRGYVKPDGSMETWMGICHGWAPAAFMVNRPKRPIVLNAHQENLAVRFYPADIKALASLTWAKNQVDTRFLGGRCNEKDTPTDPSSGRVLNEACFDTNPANWHLIVVNQIGVAKRSFVMDATFDYEVWNQPIYSYKYHYFNPLTESQESNWLDAKVSYAEFKRKDPFRKFRQNVASVVGIVMSVTYVVETTPQHLDLDSPNSDATQTVEYKYDLELNANDEIIGGEWYTRAHPDFVWVPLKGSQALSYAESTVNGGPQWDPTLETLPAFWKDIAIRSARYGQPAEFIVNGLVSASRQ